MSKNVYHEWNRYDISANFKERLIRGENPGKVPILHTAMTLTDLIAAAQNPTPEIIEEVCKRVHEARGKCWHKWVKTGFTEKGALLGLTHEDYECECGAETFWPQEETDPVPTGCDYTRPENFWPLAWENGIMVFKDIYKSQSPDCLTVATNDIERYFGRQPAAFQHPPKLVVIDIMNGNPGLAVCLAYLKIKEEEALINELDLPDAEDVLKMRGKIKEQDNEKL